MACYSRRGEAKPGPTSIKLSQRHYGDGSIIAMQKGMWSRTSRRDRSSARAGCYLGILVASTENVAFLEIESVSTGSRSESANLRKAKSFWGGTNLNRQVEVSREKVVNRLSEVQWTISTIYRSVEWQTFEVQVISLQVADVSESNIN